MTYWEAVKLSIWPALESTIDVLVYGWVLYSLIKWACSWRTQPEDDDEDEDFDPLAYAPPSGTGEAKPISHTIPGFEHPYDPETDPSHYNIGTLGSRDGERE